MNVALHHKLLKLKSDVPPGEAEAWRVERFTVSKSDASFFNLRCAINPARGDRSILPGKYTKLSYYNQVIMSDTPAEKRDHLNYILEAKGDVLVTGLGLGWVIEGLFLNPKVKTVTVIEKELDVLHLVGNHLQKKYSKKLNIICGDAFCPPLPITAKFDCIWHDIWETICGDNWPEIKELRRIYRKYCKIIYQSSWCWKQVRKLAREDKRYETM